MQPSDPDTSQQLHDAVHLAAGTRVHARGGLWRVRKVQPFASCTLVHLAGVDRANSGHYRALLVPFDCLQPQTQAAPVRVVRKQRWCRALKGLLAAHHPWHGLRAAASSRIDLIPFQLEPALASVRGVACRFLLADEVGLGKTIQAGLLIKELRQRGLADRVLILTPSGLRRQWQTELSERFSIRASVVDTALLRHRASSLPAGTNPWLLDEVAIVSIDLIKRPDAIRGLGTTAWDLVLIDEAHLAAHAAARYRAAELLAGRATRVVLITATPHAGDPAAFEALCSIGGSDASRLAMFRRSRSDVGFAASRRVRTLAITLAPDEARVHNLLRSYTRLVIAESDSRSREALLALAVLTKRALSSPASLALSVARRLEILSTGDTASTQLVLPLLEELLDDEHDAADLPPLTVLGTPALADRARELNCLREIGDAARNVAGARKLQVLLRLVARLREPVLIFTEYRDTLQQVAEALAPTVSLAVIHGGLTEAERVHAQTSFTSGWVRVLLATDAAGEGLNLQARCRLVVNLELPWNPMRLEQRIGRVDRLGQSRTVHVINLFARGTAEARVLARLVTRIESARRAVGGVNDPLGSTSLDEIADALLDVVEPLPNLLDSVRSEPVDLRPFDRLTVVPSPVEGRQAQVDPEHRRRVEERTELRRNPTGPRAHADDTEPSIPIFHEPDLRQEAITEARRLESIRRLTSHRTGTETDHEITPITTIPARRIAATLAAPSLVWFIRVHLVDGNGQLVEERIVPLSGGAPGCITGERPGRLRTLIDGLLESTRPFLATRALEAAGRRLKEIEPVYQAAFHAVQARQLYLLHQIEAESSSASLYQAGLFDRKAMRDREAGLKERSRLHGNATERVKYLKVAGERTLSAAVELVLVLHVASAATRAQP